MEGKRRKVEKGRRATPQAARGRAHAVVDLAGKSCEECGHDGSASRLEIHHRDHDPYNNRVKNLGVLCASCHRAHHPRRRGSKLDPDKVRLIRARVAVGENQYDIAADLGVSQGSVSNVALGKSWAHVS
jgi:hypothetical protein